MIYTFIDTETTGLDIFKHEIIDIAFLQVLERDGTFKEITRGQARITPKNISTATPVALKINGYTKRKWKNSIPVSKFLPFVRTAIDTSDYIVGQNLIFDYRFINKSFDQENLYRPKYPKYIDTKFMADQLVHDKKVKRSSLDFLCEHYKIPTIGRAHTAITDVLRTFELFKVLKNTTEIVYLSFDKPYDPYGDKNAAVR
jgi:DNA polymerase III epsilon subunit-like protein